MQIAQPAGFSPLHIEVRASHCLSSAQSRALLLGFAAISLIIASLFTLAGAWPILPLTGIELLVVWLVLRHHAGTADDFERLSLNHGRLMLDTQNRHHRLQHEFNLCWARVILRCGRGGNHCRLLLRAHGREYSFGRLLGDEERIRLATTLLTRQNQTQ